MIIVFKMLNIKCAKFGLLHTVACPHRFHYTLKSPTWEGFTHQQKRPLCSPVPGASRTVFLTGQHNERLACLLVPFRSIKHIKLENKTQLTPVSKNNETTWQTISSNASCGKSHFTYTEASSSYTMWQLLNITINRIGSLLQHAWKHLRSFHNPPDSSTFSEQTLFLII